jgi:hypothetical protein
MEIAKKSRLPGCTVGKLIFTCQINCMFWADPRSSAIKGNWCLPLLGLTYLNERENNPFFQHLEGLGIVLAGISRKYKLDKGPACS